ncbi:MAG: cytochrome c oxidase assembly protein [Wenzhouxiangellaceae bacterium]
MTSEQPANNQSQQQSSADLRSANRRLLRWLVLGAVGMFGFGFALWPLYNVFCDLTGIGGRTGTVSVAEAAAQGNAAASRWVTVTFDANVDPKLPWRFEPLEKSLRVQTGVLTETHYVAANQTELPVVGQAVPSVAPGQASLYFNKTECFCFTQQTLDAGQSRDMPVRFIIDPELPQHIETLTLSYTFYRQDDATAALLEHDHGAHPDHGP